MFTIAIKKPEGENYEPDTLTSKFNSIARYLRDKGYEKDIKCDKEFSHARSVLASKRKELKARGLGNRKNKAETISESDLKRLMSTQQIGIGKYTKLKLHP